MALDTVTRKRDEILLQKNLLRKERFDMHRLQEKELVNEKRKGDSVVKPSYTRSVFQGTHESSRICTFATEDSTLPNQATRRSERISSILC